MNYDIYNLKLALDLTVNIKRHCFRREAENWWASLWDASQIRGWTVETGQTGPDNGFKLLNTEY